MCITMKQPPTFKYAAPGSMMLMGEHAVLRGKHAIVMSIDQHIQVTLQARLDRAIHIKSTLGTYQGSLDKKPPIKNNLSYVINMIHNYWDDIPHGFDLCVTSNISDQHGLGSSAAVVAATHACFLHWIHGQPAQPDTIFDAGLRTIHTLKKVGSGADLAASVYGGTVLYLQTPRLIQPLQAQPPIKVIYSGKKTPTDQVIAHVQQRWAQSPDQLSQFDESMDALTLAAVSCINTQAWQDLGKLCLQQQQLLAELGVHTPELQAAIDTLVQHPKVTGAKISGSGLGDCVVGICQDHDASLEQLPLNCQAPLLQLDVHPSTQGVCHA